MFSIASNVALVTVIGPLIEVPVMLALVRVAIATRSLRPQNRRLTNERRMVTERPHPVQRLAEQSTKLGDCGSPGHREPSYRLRPFTNFTLFKLSGTTEPTFIAFGCVKGELLWTTRGSPMRDRRHERRDGAVEVLAPYRVCRGTPRDGFEKGPPDRTPRARA